MDSVKETQFVTHVLRQTQSGLLKWRRQDAPTSLFVGTENRVFDFFAVNAGAKVLGIYESRSPTYDGDRDTFHWGSDLYLSLFDRQLNCEYTFRAGSAIWDLFREVKRQTAGVDDFMEEFIKQDSKAGE